MGPRRGDLHERLGREDRRRKRAIRLRSHVLLDASSPAVAGTAGRRARAVVGQIGHEDPAERDVSRIRIGEHRRDASERWISSPRHERAVLTKHEGRLADREGTNGCACRYRHRPRHRGVARVRRERADLAVRVTAPAPDAVADCGARRPVAEADLGCRRQIDLHRSKRCRHRSPRVRAEEGAGAPAPHGAFLVDRARVIERDDIRETDDTRCVRAVERPRVVAASELARAVRAPAGDGAVVEKRAEALAAIVLVFAERRHELHRARRRRTDDRKRRGVDEARVGRPRRVEACIARRVR